MVISDYQQMDRILKEERNYILQMIKKIRASGCNVLLIQKSILRDAVTDLSLHYLVSAVPPAMTGWASDLVLRQGARSCVTDVSLCPCCSVRFSACQQWHAAALPPPHHLVGALLATVPD